MKFLRKIFSLDFWFRVEGSSVYDVQEKEVKYVQQINLLRFYNTKYSKQLVDLGDNSEIPREIFHFFHFKRSTNLENFTNRIRKFDFVAVSKFPADDNVYCIGYKIMRIDKTNTISVNDFTELLCRAAYEAVGVYKNWETIPCKLADD
jgi:hypothetical protein